MIKIALAEDNGFLAASIRQKVELFADLEFVFHASNGEQLLEQMKEHEGIDVILMDIQMPEMDGIEATRQVLRSHKDVRVIMLTVLDSEQSIYEAIKTGASGYLLKESGPDEIHSAIVQATQGGASMSPTVAMKAMQMIQDPERVARESPEFDLSDREQEVLRHLSDGLNYKQIASLLFISPHTVRRHIENVYQKLGVHNKAEALQIAYRYRLV